MSTATATKERQQTYTRPADNNTPVSYGQATLAKVFEFVPLGAGESIKLSCDIIRLILNPRTKSGRTPPDDQVMKFIMLCQARRLNPFENDAYLIGYEGQDGDAWSLITSIYAFLKRAEVNPQYEGIESGVIVETKDGAIEEHVGDFLRDDEKLLGGWAVVHRSDRKFPNKKRVEFKRYSTGKSRWQADPGGMICKVAECQALRDTFPTTLGGLFIGEEVDKEMRTIEPTQINVLPSKSGSLKPHTNGAPKAVDAPTPARQAEPDAAAADDGEILDEAPTDATPAQVSNEITDEEKAAIAAQEAAAAFDPETASKDELIAAIKPHLERLKKREPWLCGQVGLSQRELHQCTEGGLRAAWRFVSKEGVKQ